MGIRNDDPASREAVASRHLRAHCHETHKFGDFTIARIVTAQLSDEPWISGITDNDWHERIDLEFEINPQLGELAQAALRQDYGKEGDSTFTIQGVRKAIAFYLARRFTRIDRRYNAPLWQLVR